MTTLLDRYTGRRAVTCRLLVGAAVTLCVPPPGAQLTASVAPGLAPHISVREEAGVYSVTARFHVEQPPVLALAVLSDYEQIPRFMPDVSRSVVLEQTPGRLLVEQEAVSRFLMFSKKVHLVLEVVEEADALRFIDRCGKSFTSYEGSWRATRTNGTTVLTYELTATPAFEVPEFILKRLLKRDSARMIEGLKREIAARAVR